MRDPNRIHTICLLLEEIWAQTPDWRFGQLLCNMNLFNKRDGLSFYQEDDITLEKLKDIAYKIQEVND